MSDPFLGEIKVIAFNFPPKGWAFCNGQLLPINQNQALFSILGTFYGGNGTTNFALPNFQGRTALHQSSDYVIGQTGGEAAHTLTANEMPVHNHFARAASAASSPGGDPTNAVWAAGGTDLFDPATPTTSMAPYALDNAGSSQPHPNWPPYLVLNFVIALQGIFPARN